MSKFITFEGTEGAGKSTLIQPLALALRARGLSVTVTREPGGSPLAEIIRDVIINNSMNPWTELFLYEAARAEHLFKTLIPSIKKGNWVLCDRYTDSSLAYQGFARGLDIKTVKKLNQIATQNLNPHLTVFLDVDPASGLRSAKIKNRFEKEGVFFQTQVRKGFLNAIRSEPHRFIKMKAKKASPDAMAQQLIKEFEKRKWLSKLK